MTLGYKMPNINKELAKCKHPNSRKFIALTKHAKKVTSRQKSKLGNLLKQNVIGEKLLWFKENLVADTSCYTVDQTEDIINRYLSRFDEELEQINIKHSIGNRKNRQHANREDIINLTIKREREEFNTYGIEMPDLMSVAQLQLLKQWNGELRYLQNFKLRRIGTKHLDQERQKSLVQTDDSCVN